MKLYFYESQIAGFTLTENVPLTELPELIGSKRLRAIHEAVETYHLPSLAQLAKASSTSIICCPSGKVILAYPRYVCGVRLSPWGETVLSDLEFHEVKRLVDDLAFNLKSEIVQIEIVLKSKVDSFQPPPSGYSYSALVFQWTPMFTDTFTQKINYKRLEPKDLNLSDLAQAELFTGAQIPGLTSKKKFDFFDNIKTSYSEAINSMLEVVAVATADQTSTALAFVDKSTQTAQIAFVWVPEQARGLRIGAKLLAALTLELKSMGVERTRAVVSMLNFPVIKALGRAGHKPQRIIVNKYLE